VGLHKQVLLGVLVPTTKFKMVLDPPSRSIGPPAIRFMISGHPLFISTHQAQQCWAWLVRGCVRVPHRIKDDMNMCL